MSLEVIIEILSLVLAVGGILLQTSRDPSKAPSWSNLSTGGRFVLLLIIVAAVFKIHKSELDDQAQRKYRKDSDDKIAELQKTNNHLIKAISVSNGYNALLSGYVVFAENQNQYKVREALENLFLKYAEVGIGASNSLGNYYGRVDYGINPEVRRFRNFQTINTDKNLLQLKKQIVDQKQKNTFYFEIRCGNLKILNQDKIQYVNLDSTDRIWASAKVFDYWGDFRSLYSVENMYLDKLVIEELGEIPLKQKF